MKCQDVEKFSLDYLMNRLPSVEAKELEAHAASCAVCENLLEGMKTTWARLDEQPRDTPGPGLRLRFDEMLSAEKRLRTGRKSRSLVKEKTSGWLSRRIPPQPAFGFALSFGLIVIGFLSGYIVRGGAAGSGEVSALHSEMTEMRQMLTLSLLNQPSSSERLLGVQVSKQIPKPDDAVIEALVHSLNADPSTNVRLAAVDALYLYRDRPRIREALVRSLESQKSPLVQIQLIDLLVEIREQKALDALRFLIQKNKLNADVKEHAEWGIQKLS
jgi:hypothetical protein